MASLERRFGISLALVLVTAFGLILLLSVSAVRSLSEAYLLTRLEHDAEALAAAVGVTPRGEPRVREGRVTPIYKQPLSGHYYVIRFDHDTILRSRSLWDETLPLNDLSTGDVQVRRIPGPGGQALLARSAGYQRSGVQFTLLVAEDLAPMSAHIDRFQYLVLGLLLLTLLALLLAQRLVLRRGFRDLDQIRSQMRQLADGSRPDLEQLGPNEIRPLTTELNRLLHQLHKQLQRSRESLGNLAHAVKSPLSLLVQQVDAMSLSNQQRASMTANLERIQGLIDRELKRARLAAGNAGQRFSPRLHVPELIAALRQLHNDKRIEITVLHMPADDLALDYQDLTELLGNLLDNACKHAARHIELDIRSDDVLHIRVADDGPGVSDEQMASLVQRGTRLDEQKPGDGLGLAIVADMVNDYQGRLDLARSSKLGGLEVRIDLPLPSSTGH
jgi:signal transduction histidine kinase